jgi:creatinine amidohydrolase
MQLVYSTWVEVRDYLERGTGIIIPSGSCEQHGPTGMIGTDAICAQTVAVGLGRKLDAMVGPLINVGMSVHHLAFPGTVTLLPSTMLLVVRDTILALARHGFERFFFLNGHGGNMPTLKAAFSEVYARAPEGASLRCKAINWWESPKVGEICKELFGDEDGMHATASELSLAMFAHPDREKIAEVDPPCAVTDDFYGPEDFRGRFPDGRIGSNPKLADLDKGRRIYEAAVDDISEMYTAFLNEN